MKNLKKLGLIALTAMSFSAMGQTLEIKGSDLDRQNGGTEVDAELHMSASFDQDWQVQLNNLGVGSQIYDTAAVPAETALTFAESKHENIFDLSGLAGDVQSAFCANLINAPLISAANLACAAHGVNPNSVELTLANTIGVKAGSGTVSLMARKRAMSSAEYDDAQGTSGVTPGEFDSISIGASVLSSTYQSIVSKSSGEDTLSAPEQNDIVVEMTVDGPSFNKDLGGVIELYVDTSI